MNRRGFLSLLGLAPLAPFAAAATKAAEPSPVIGIDLGAGDDLTGIAFWRPFTMRTADLELISSRSFASHEVVPPFVIDPAQAILLVRRQFRNDELLRFFPGLPASSLPDRKEEL